MSCLTSGGFEHTTVDGVFIKRMALDTAGLLVPQHSHKYAHTTLVASGAVRVWREDKLLGDYFAPAEVYISAGAKHTLMSLAANTVAYCIHNVSRNGYPEVLEEHDFYDGKALATVGDK